MKSSRWYPARQRCNSSHSLVEVTREAAMSSFPLFLKDEPTRAKPTLTFATRHALWSIGGMDRSNFVCVNGRVFSGQHLAHHSAATALAGSGNHGNTTGNGSFVNAENRTLCGVCDSVGSGAACLYHFNARVPEEPLVRVVLNTCRSGRIHR